MVRSFHSFASSFSDARLFLATELDKVRDVKKFVPLKKQPDFIKGGKLMPFQLEGVNFLYLCVPPVLFLFFLGVAG